MIGNTWHDETTAKDFDIPFSWMQRLFRQLI